MIWEPPALQGHVKSDFVFLGMNIILTKPCGGGPHADKRRGTVCACGLMNAPVISEESWKQNEFSRSGLKYHKCVICESLFDFSISESGVMREDEPQLGLLYGVGETSLSLCKPGSQLCVCVDKSSHLLVGVL